MVGDVVDGDKADSLWGSPPLVLGLALVPREPTLGHGQ